MRRFLLLPAVLCASCGHGDPAAPAPAPAAAPEWKPLEGGDLVGTPAPEFTGLSDWTNTAPLTIESLKGKIVLVRFWTAGCSLCTGSAAALNEADQRFRDRGLVVVGVHHPKDRASVDAAVWRAAAKKLGFEFALAQDLEWSTVEAWWLERGAERSFTSATFLVDRKGVIRWLHPGGTIRQGEGEEDEAYRSMFESAERLVAEGG